MSASEQRMRTAYQWYWASGQVSVSCTRRANVIFASSRLRSTPLLFLLLNDLPDNLTSTSTTPLFADDCLLYRSITSTEDSEALQRDLDSFYTWQTKWQMRFNASKCYVMNISRSRSVTHHTYKLCNWRLLHPIHIFAYIFKIIWNGIHKLLMSHLRQVGFLASYLYHLESLTTAQITSSKLRTSAWLDHTPNTPRWFGICTPRHILIPSKKCKETLPDLLQRTSPGTVTKLTNDLQWDSLQHRHQVARL